MQRSLGFDVVACPRCGDRADGLIEDPAVIRRILDHLGLPTEIPACPAAIAARFESSNPRYDDDVAVP